MQVGKSARIVTPCLTFLNVFTLTAVHVNVTALLVVVPFSLIESHKIFKEPVTFKLAVASSETLVTLYQIKRRNILPVNSTPQYVITV